MTSYRYFWCLDYTKMDHFLSSSSTGIITSDAFVSRCTLVLLSIEVSLPSELRLRLISRHNNLEPVHNTREARTLLLFDFGINNVPYIRLSLLSTTFCITLLCYKLISDQFHRERCALNWQGKRVAIPFMFSDNARYAAITPWTRTCVVSLR